jgi:CheY-like chemotaxis protein
VAASAGPTTSGAVPHFSGRVLLVEDNPVNALVAEANLARLGLDVTRAEDGAQALSMLQHLERPFDLVLMDLQMPELDGMEATRRLRSWENDQRLDPIPVVALTANALSTDRARCLSAGMDDHLPKPFRVEELMAVLQRHLPPSAPGVVA